MYDCIVIGAGPSGMMAAICASKNNKKTLLLEKNNILGKKMSLTGGRRCNITNLKDNDSFINNLPTKNGRFLYSSLNNFGPKEIYQYFNNLGIKLKEVDNNRIFPISNNALDFIDALHQELIKNNVVIKLNTEVIDISKDNHFLVKTKNKTYKSKNIIIATGGLSYPHTGSTGFGYEVAKKFNHTVTEIYPCESPIISHDEIIKNKALQGLSFSKINLSLCDDKKTIKTINDDLIITHFGLSGPAALKLSQFVYHYLKDSPDVIIKIDFIPNITDDELIDLLKQNPKKILKNYLPKRLIDFIYNHFNITDNNKLIKYIKYFPLKAHQVKPITVSFITGGGVSLKEINPKTMESKITPGLYFVGEVLDLHGYTGGYNLTIALSTGYTAGININ